MQQFPVPKYIDLQAHILGPLSISQTITVILSGALIMVLYLVLEPFLFVSAAIIIGFAAMIVGFGNINGRPMADFLFDMLTYTINPRVYMWTPKEKSAATETKTPQKTRAKKEIAKPRLSSNVTPEQIHALAQALDVLKDKSQFQNPNDK